MTSPFQPSAVLIIRCRVNADHIRLSARSQANPSAGDYWREQFKRVLRCFAAPASFSRYFEGTFLGRTMNFCGSLSRWSFQPLVKFCQEPASSFSKCFNFSFGSVLGHVDKLTEESGTCVTENGSKMTRVRVKAS